MDFFLPIDDGAFNALVDQMAATVKPQAEMSPIEYAEFRVLEAALNYEEAKKALIYTRITGERAPD